MSFLLDYGISDETMGELMGSPGLDIEAYFDEFGIFEDMAGNFAPQESIDDDVC